MGRGRDPRISLRSWLRAADSEERAGLPPGDSRDPHAPHPQTLCVPSQLAMQTPTAVVLVWTSASDPRKSAARWLRGAESDPAQLAHPHHGRAHLAGPLTPQRHVPWCHQAHRMPKAATRCVSTEPGGPPFCASMSPRTPPKETPARRPSHSALRKTCAGPCPPQTMTPGASEPTLCSEPRLGPPPPSWLVLRFVRRPLQQPPTAPATRRTPRPAPRSQIHVQAQRSVWALPRTILERLGMPGGPGESPWGPRTSHVAPTFLLALRPAAGAAGAALR